MRRGNLQFFSGKLEFRSGSYGWLLLQMFSRKYDVIFDDFVVIGKIHAGRSDNMLNFQNDLSIGFLIAFSKGFNLAAGIRNPCSPTGRLHLLILSRDMLLPLQSL